MNEKISIAVKKRWAKTSKKKRKAHASMMASAKAKSMTKKERSEHASMMAVKRFGVKS